MSARRAGEGGGRGRGGGRGLARMAMQLAGFALCLALLLGLIHRALSDPQTRHELLSLAHAPRGDAAVLLALTAASMFLNGLTFWLVIRPVRPIPHSDVQAVNGVAYLMANLPLRLGLLFRIAVHHRRDRLPLLTVGAWMGATAVVMAVGLAPPLLAGLWRSGPDGWWWATSIGGMALGGAAVVLIARFFSTGRGWGLIEELAERRADSVLGRALRSDAMAQLHEGVHMLADPGAVAAAVAVRAFDILVQGLRFMVAASLLGIALPLDQAVLLTVVYFTIDSIAPTGSLGLKEAGTAIVAGAVGEANMDATVLTVTAAELIVRFAGAGAGAIWLRPDRLLRNGRAIVDDGEAAPEETKETAEVGQTDGADQGAARSTAACSDAAGSTDRT